MGPHHVLDVVGLIAGSSSGPAFAPPGLNRDGWHQQVGSRRGLRLVVGAQQVGGELPAVGGQPVLHGFGWGPGVNRRGGGEVAGEDRPVPAHRAGDVDHGVMGLAVAAVLSEEESPGLVGVGAEPGDGEVGALGGGFLPGGGVMPAARTGPGRSGC